MKKIAFVLVFAFMLILASHNVWADCYQRVWYGGEDIECTGDSSFVSEGYSYWVSMSNCHCRAEPEETEYGLNYNDFGTGCSFDAFLDWFGSDFDYYYNIPLNPEKCSPCVGNDVTTGARQWYDICEDLSKSECENSYHTNPDYLPGEGMFQSAFIDTTSKLGMSEEKAEEYGYSAYGFQCVWDPEELCSGSAEQGCCLSYQFDWIELDWFEDEKYYTYKPCNPPYAICEEACKEDPDYKSAEGICSDSAGPGPAYVKYEGTMNPQDCIEEPDTTCWCLGGCTPQRKQEKYQGKVAFIVSDKDWKDVLTLYPVAMWYNEDGELEKHPFLIYHNEENAYDADSVFRSLQQYKPKRVIAVDYPGNELPAGFERHIDASEIEKISVENYLDFWESYCNVVYVEADPSLAMQASQYAAMINGGAPLIIKGTVLDKPETFKDKNVALVGNLSCPEEAVCNDDEKFSDVTSIQKAIVKLIGEKGGTADKIILTNPRDVSEDTTRKEGIMGKEGVEYTVTNYPDRYYEDLLLITYKSGGEVKKLYYMDSLTASAMAIAKNAVMFFTDVDAFSYGIRSRIRTERKIDYSDNYIAIDNYGHLINGSYDSLSKIDIENDRRLWKKEIGSWKNRLLGIAVDKTNSIIGVFYTSQNQELQLRKFTPEGVATAYETEPFKLESYFGVGVLDLYITEDGYMYLIFRSEKGESHILKYDKDFNLVWAKDSPLQRGRDWMYLRVLFATNSKIYLNDIVEGRAVLRVFDLELNHQRDISLLQEAGKKVSGFAVDNVGYIYVLWYKDSGVPTGRGKLVRYKPTGELDKTLTEDAPAEFIKFNPQKDKLYFKQEIRNLNGEVIKLFGLGDSCLTRVKYFPNLDKKLEENAAKVHSQLLEQVNLFPENQFKYLILIGSPRAIPSSRMAKDKNGKPICHVESDYRVSLDDEYATVGNSKLSVARISEATISDSSSLVFRSIFYDQIYSGEIRNLLFISHSYENLQWLSSAMANKMRDGFNTTCFMEDREDDIFSSCELNISPDISVYENQGVVFFRNHGSYNWWARTLHSFEIKNLNFGIGIGDACLTNNYYQSVNDDLFSVNWLRQGGIGYYGSVGVTKDLGYQEAPIYNLVFKYLMEGDDTGTALRKAIDYYSAIREAQRAEGKVLDEADRVELHISLLGDPTFKPKISPYEIDVIKPEAKFDISPSTKATKGQYEIFIVNPNEEITFDASGSTDNEGIEKYIWESSVFRKEDWLMVKDGPILKYTFPIDELRKDFTFSIELTTLDSFGNSDRIIKVMEVKT